MTWREEGERALLRRWPGPPAPETTARILALRERIAAARPRWLEEAVPGMSSLLVVYDPLSAGPDAVRRFLEELSDDPARLPEPRTLEIPVQYGGEEGPDLARVAAQARLSAEEVVRRHSKAQYRVAFLGFTPGFPYLQGLPPELCTPRLDTPRSRVPAGSVAIGGAQTGIYPRESPGGWNLIGRTPAALCDWTREDPFLLRPGDRVIFVPEEVLDFPAPAPLAGRAAAHAVLEIAAPGLLTTVQDLGRPGHAHRGVPPSGPMDPLALRLANLAVGNAESAPALELTFPGPRVLFLERGSFALGGADLSATLSGKPLPAYERVDAAAGEELRFERQRSGQWAYLAVAGGLLAGRRLGSASTDTRSGLGRLSPGVRLALAGPAPASGRSVPRALAALPAEGAVVRFVEAGERPPAPLDGLQVTLSAKRDRSGYHAGSPVLPGGEGSEVSEGIAPGTIQLPPAGRMIFLLADRPPTGGYRKLAYFATVDARVIAQTPPGARLTLMKIAADEARRLVREERAALEGIARPRG